MSLMSLTAVELAKKIKAGETTAVEAAKDALAQIKEKEESIHSYVTVLDEAQILEKAGEVQKKIQAGELTGPLAGVPVANKDNMCTEGILTTCSSKILGNFVPTYSSEASILSRSSPLATTSSLNTFRTREKRRNLHGTEDI